jgi:twitching motility protein PilT
MQTFNQGLATLYQRKLITLQIAMSYSSNTDELQDMINRGTGIIQQAPTSMRPPITSGRS